MSKLLSVLVVTALAGCTAEVPPQPGEATVNQSVSSTVRLIDSTGATISYASRTAEERRAIDRSIDAFVARRGGREPVGCSLGPDLEVSCWGFGFMCAAWLDSDGVGAQCWRCDIADCQ
jgi:hypothetical protein